MPNYLGRFAINADNVRRAREFYQKVFDWKFEPWGPPNFYLIDTGDAPPAGSGGLLQERRELVPGVKMIGFECTFVVENLDHTIRAIESNGGKMVTEKFRIPTVCTVAYFQDTEGNVAAVSELESA
jgi:uncharacterized protein